MAINFKSRFLGGSLPLILAMASCSGPGSNQQSQNNLNDEMVSIQIDSVDSLIVLDNDTMPVEEPEVHYDFADADEVLKFIGDKEDASRYAGGIIPVIAKNVPKYAAKLFTELEKYSSFIVVDKASMRVLLYDRYGQLLKAYDMACAKNYGTKHKKADSRTPEGFFSIEGKYDSTDWLFTDDDGVTSKKKGQFGPRFLRIKTPVSMQIGIHGTGSPWSMGHRVSHGCIRVTNEHIMELFDLVEKGMPVIVLPGKRDRAVNRKEGYDIPYFPTDIKYAMSEAEKKEKVNPDPEKDEDKDKEKAETNKAQKVENDSTKSEIINIEPPTHQEPEKKEQPESSDSVSTMRPVLE